MKYYFFLVRAKYLLNSYKIKGFADDGDYFIYESDPNENCELL